MSKVTLTAGALRTVLNDARVTDATPITLFFQDTQDGWVGGEAASAEFRVPSGVYPLGHVQIEQTPDSDEDEDKDSAYGEGTAD